jgi:hyaluronoglucosaminidase
MTPLPWPREAWDGPATVRDGHLDTGFLLPANSDAQENWLELDLLPWFGRAVSLDSLTLLADPTVELSATCTILPHCLADDDAGTPCHLNSGTADLKGETAGCVRLGFTNDHMARVLDVNLTTRDGSIVIPDIELPVDSGERERYPNYGVVEGFYGAPWSFRERTRIVHLMSHLGMDTYIYGPKLDPLHRAEWRTSYPEAMMQGFQQLAEYASSAHVRFFMGISPFIDFGNQEDDFQTLLEKLQAFVDAGVDGIALLADDIEFETERPVDAAMGLDQAAAVNEILSTLRKTNPDLVIWFCPTVYSMDRLHGMPQGVEYLQALQDLDPDVEIMWTGDDTFNEIMDGPDMDEVTALIGRPVLIWDNFWANDGGDGFIGRILLGPYGGRTPSLPGAVSGIVNNPSIQGAMTRLDLVTFGAWLRNPAQYDPTQAIAEAVEREAALTAVRPGASHEEDRHLLATLIALFDAHTTGIPGHRDMETRVATVVDSLKKDPVQAIQNAPGLLRLLAEFATLNSQLYHSGLDADLVDEAWYPVFKVQAEALSGIRALQMACDRLSGRTGAHFDELIQQAQDLAATGRFQFSTGTMDGLVEAVRALAPVNRGCSPVAPAVPPKTPCRPGVSWSWRPYPDCEDVAVFGLPGAEVDSTGRISWSPPYAGEFHVSVLCINTTQPGWGWESRVLNALP